MKYSISLNLKLTFYYLSRHNVFNYKNHVFLKVVLETLLDTSGDAESTVREAVCKALQKLAKERTDEVVLKICMYKEKKGRVSICY